MEAFAAVAAIITALGGLLFGLHRLISFLLDWVSQQQARHEVFMAGQHTEWQAFIGNHMSQNVKSQAANTKALEKLAKGVEVLHHDNIKTAAVLREQDETIERFVTRKNGDELEEGR